MHYFRYIIYKTFRVIDHFDRLRCGIKDSSNAEIKNFSNAGIKDFRNADTVGKVFAWELLAYDYIS